jgi:hypothetical protein
MVRTDVRAPERIGDCAPLGQIYLKLSAFDLPQAVIPAQAGI